MQTADVGVTKDQEQPHLKWNGSLPEEEGKEVVPVSDLTQDTPRDVLRPSNHHYLP